MSNHPHGDFSSCRWFLVCAFLILAACNAPVEGPKGWAQVYQDVKDTFSKGDFERAITFSDPIVSATPTNSYTDKALVVRAVIYAGEVKAYKELEEAWTKGIQAAKTPSAKSELERARTDFRQYGTKAALGLAGAALKLTKEGKIPTDLALEAAYPSVEGPTEVKELDRVRDGGTLSADDQEGAARDAVRKGVDDALANLAGGDRSKARSSFTGSSVPIKELDFALFLDHQLVDAATLFDLKHVADPAKLALVCDQGDRVTEAALALLKENPDKAKEKELKKVQDQFKALRKSVQ